MPNVRLERKDHPGGVSLWEASVLLEPKEPPVVRYGRSVGFALRKLAQAVNEREQAQILSEMKKDLDNEEEGQDGTQNSDAK